ncbi:unnamed protein product [Xylocopa violacea]|uniref:Uncharacterized protein n=2 Tax=Xylocopa violacea TaxID=135666 RepID=A0ABP1NDV0_XYLVO
MKSDDFTWTVVPNTVADRMSYSQYIKMKTSVLRKESDESDTEDNVSLTEDDYNILCKSDLSLTQMSNESSFNNLSHSDEELESNEDFMSDTESETAFTQKSKNKSQETTNIDWQIIAKKRSRSISPSRKKKNVKSSTCTNAICPKADDVETSTQTNSNILNEKSISNKSSKKNILSTENKVLHIDERTVESHAEDTNSNEITCNTTTVQEVINTTNESVPLNPTKNKISKILESDKEHCYKIPNSPNKEKLLEVVNTNNESVSPKPIKNKISKILESDKEHCYKIPNSPKEEKLLEVINTNNESVSPKPIKNKISKILESDKEHCYKIPNSPKKEKLLEVINTNNESVPIKPIKNNISKILESDKEHCYKIPNSPKKEKLEEMKKKVTPLLDTVKDVQNTNDPCTSTNEPLDQNHLNLNIESNVQNSEPLEIQSPNIAKKHQPKDSGIEDTDEEFVEHDEKYKNETQKVEQNLSTLSSNLECKDDVVHVPNNLKSKNPNSPRVDPEDVPSTNEEVSTNEQEHEEKLQKPIVISTEIVNRKYKIIPNTSMFNKHAEPEESNMKDFWNKRLYETEDIEENIEGGVSPLTKKRLQQFRRLNLTIESDSSLSENDIRYSHESMREKLFNRDKESDMSGSEDESIHYVKQSSFIGDDSIKHNSNHLNNIVNHDVDQDEDESCTESFHEKNLDIEITQQPVNKKTVNGKNLDIEITQQSVNKKTVIHRRPCNLKELTEQEGLVLKTPKPSFKYKNIGEDELFIIDLPSKVLENQLLGSKMILTENKLKLGKQKYKIKYKEINKISCVFASTKRNKPYRTVNIKPLTRIVTRQKLHESN